MKFLAWALRLTALAVAVTACGSAPAGAGNSGWPIDRTFVSTSLTGHTLVAGTRISLTFHRNGTVSAYAGCSELSGTGRLSGGRLIISQLAQTMIGCEPDRMNQDQWLTGFLTRRPEWHLAGNQLQLTEETARLTLTDRATSTTARGVTGTRWVVEAVTTRRTASSVPAGSAYLTFDESGHISGSDACAPISGTAVIGSATMTVALAPAAHTCPAPAATVASAIHATLQGTVGYAIRADTLTLTGPDGHGLLLRAAG
jgi:heat shock protein HslJ